MLFLKINYIFNNIPNYEIIYNKIIYKIKSIF